MSEAAERMGVMVCGRGLGTASNWEWIAESAVVFHDFHPIADLSLPFTGRLGNLIVDFDSGLISLNDTTIDLVDALRDIPRMIP